MTIEEAKKEREILEDQLTTVMHSFILKTKLKIADIKIHMVGSTPTIKISVLL